MPSDAVAALEAGLRALAGREISSLADPEAWLAGERALWDEIDEALSVHRIDFFRDTASAGKRETHRHDQADVMPLVARCQAACDRRPCACPFTAGLDGGRCGRMRSVRRRRVGLYREENVPLAVRERELAARYGGRADRGLGRRGHPLPAGAGAVG